MHVLQRGQVAAFRVDKIRRLVRVTNTLRRAPILIDARLKPGFPRELSADPDTAATVTRRWKEYFPSGVEMGDSEAGHLDPA